MEGLKGRAEPLPPQCLPCCLCCPQPPRSPDHCPEGCPLSLVDFALCFLTRHVLLAPHPISPCTVVPVVVSLWLFIGHSPPVSSFCEGKRPQPGAGGWRERPQQPLGLGCVLSPCGTEAWGKGLFFFIFLECVFSWSGLWSGLIFVFGVVWTSGISVS